MIDMNKIVDIKSTVNAQVGITYANKNLRRTWAQKGAVQRVKFEDLQEALFEPGIEYLFKTGVLYIEDMAIKIALGLEPEEAEEPKNVIVLDEKQMKRLLTVAPLYELKSTLDKLSHEQTVELANYAIAEKITTQDKIELIEKASNVDIFNSVTNKIREERRDLEDKRKEGK